MNDITLDPSETRPRPVRAPRKATAMRIACLSAAAVVGLGGFGYAASHVLGGLAGPQKVAPSARRNAADWPDLKDGVPVLATGTLSPAPIAAASPSVVPPVPSGSNAASADQTPRMAALPPAGEPSSLHTQPSPSEKPSRKAAEAPPRRLPAIENAAVLPPNRQAVIVAPPARTVATIVPKPAETIRAKSAGTAFAALPPEPAKPESSKSDAVRPEGAKAESTRPDAAKPKKVAATKKPPVNQTASAAPEPESEETEVFGIKMPSLAPAGRKLREGVEALGDAVKNLGGSSQ